MKLGRNSILILGVAIVVAILLLRHRNPNLSETERQFRRSVITERKEAAEKSASLEKRPLVSNPYSFTKRFEDMTEAEKAHLAKRFSEQYKPIVDKWFDAYDGRIPFRREEFTLNTFHSCLGDYMYTFIIGDTTFTIQDSAELGLKVSYLMTRRCAAELNRLPGNGFVPDLNIPVAQKDVIRMVKTDTGVEFNPNEVIIRPTAAATALNGGAFVSFLPTGKDPNNALNYPISLVFGPDGNVVKYVRDPFF